MPNQNNFFTNSLISVAIATYNGETFLRQQLDTVIAQTYKNIEIIISDDGSTDRTVEIIKSYVKQHTFIKIFENKNPIGINKNFENAIKNCAGQYIALCDQDDIWLPAKLEMLISKIGKSALIYHNSLFVDINGESLNKSIADKMNCYSGSDPKVFLLLNCVSGHVCMFNKNLLQYAIPFPTVKFYDWWLAFVATQYGGITYLDEILVHYRQHEMSKTDMLALKKSTKHKKEYIIYEEQLEWFKNCAEVAKTDKPFFKQWLKLYRNRKNQWFSFSLFLLTQKNKRKLYNLKNKGEISKLFESLKLLWGLKIKKILGS